MTVPTPEERQAIRRDVEDAVAHTRKDEMEQFPDGIRALLDDCDT